YASNFRYYAARARLDVLIEAYTTQVPDDLEGILRKIRDQRPDCLAYLGYGYPTILMAPMFRNLGWDPPRIMTSAFQFCYAKPEWMAALEGWYGIDQMCEENPRLGPMLDRFADHLGKRRDHTVTALSYDTTRLIAEGLARALQASRRGRAGGLCFAGRRIAYGELSAAVDELAAWLVRRGLGTGQPIGVQAANEPAVVAMLFAVWGIGAVAVPIAVRSTAEE